MSRLDGQGVWTESVLSDANEEVNTTLWEMHEAIVSSVEGRHMSLDGVAVREPPEGEPEPEQLCGRRNRSLQKSG